MNEQLEEPFYERELASRSVYWRTFIGTSKRSSGIPIKRSVLAGFCDIMLKSRAHVRQLQWDGTLPATVVSTLEIIDSGICWP